VAVAFFDLDRTLIAKNSGFLWVRSELRGGHIDGRTALEAFTWLVRYHFGTVKLEAALYKGVAILTGTRELDLINRVQRFYDDEIHHLYRPGANQALAEHRAKGDRIVLLTTSSIYLSRAVSAAIELDGMLCNSFELDADGVFTGEPILPFCFGAGKLTHAQRWLDEHGEDLAEATFYTDSISDAPMMEAVGRAVAVNPDRALKKHARRRGWPIVDWGTP